MSGASDLVSIVERVGGQLYAGGTQAAVPGPGHSRRDRSLSLRLSDDGERVIFYSHAGDSAREVMSYLGIEARHSDSRSSREERAKIERAREQERRKREAEDLAFCGAVWAGTIPLEGTPAAAYLWNRGLVADGAPPLRFHPAAPRAKTPDAGTAPALVALVSDFEGSAKALHLTYITDDGRKAFGDRSRLMFGATAGCAVRMSPIGAGGTLAIGEGIETSASYELLKGVPTWSALSSSGVGNFILPAPVRHLIIAADGDSPGLSAARALAERLERRCKVTIDSSPEGQDWNDVLMGEGA